MLPLLQSSPMIFAIFASILCLLIGTFGSDVTRQLIRLHRNYPHE